ncbi:hypothetical protein CYMTET_24376 [Cymbomonas tetramitiformis]|uniref:Uncharacterized protein n=1 Tax=Cymbomonas tetramitiformis TaxID=36881 RepID=A0AAE0L047_9CHLO|nr:hypothetical protein CYMTET_24376 [Cymbomonas tetramitiformis]
MKNEDIAIEFFKSRGEWSANFLDRPGEDYDRPDCPQVYVPRGCINYHKLATFLDGKWIPGREASQDSHFVETGHYFQRDYDRKTGPTSDAMFDFIAYVASRPWISVPQQVRKMMSDRWYDAGAWPGKNERSPFLPPSAPPSDRLKLSPQPFRLSSGVVQPSTHPSNWLNVEQSKPPFDLDTPSLGSTL